MSNPELTGLSPDEDDELLAAEFVLGGLAGADQAVLDRRAGQDAAFARRIAAWEERLFPLTEAYVPAPPSAHLKPAIDLRLFGAPPRRDGIFASLTFWRGLSAALGTAVVLALLLPALRPAPVPQRLAASLSAEGSDLRYMALYDPTAGRISLAPLSGAPVAGRNFQLWIARGSEAPVSLGVIPAAVATEVAITSDQLRALMTPAAHIAISLEPPGGSPTGQPTGPVLAVRDLLHI